MKLSERLRTFTTRVKSYFVSDQVRSFVLFLEDFFPSGKIFGLYGFTFFDGLQNSVNQRRQKQFFWISVAVIVTLISLLASNFMVNATKPEKLTEATESYTWMSGFIMVLVKTYFLCSQKRAAIRKILHRLDQYFPHSNRKQLQFGAIKHYRYMKKLFRICLTCYGGIWLHYTYMSLLQLIFGHAFELIAPIYFPFDPLQPLLYPIFISLQSWSVLFAALMLTATDSFFCSLICVTSMEFDVLAQKLSQIDPESDENAEKKLQEIIDGYNELTDIANELEKIFSPLLFVHIFAGIFQLCSTAFLSFSPIRHYLMIKYSITVPLILFHVYSICFYGEQLQTSSMRVADEAYNCNWYGKNLKFRKMILLTMLRTQRPQKLTGLKFMNVGLPVFYWSLQIVHSYYSLLCGLYEH
ncbi:hypothetical protein PVAND_003159 [Polypedilum vanderplanki]|uniref:Odorant receptor n=1 Tax=Polypedilum vanderplanki TaxID=319348 RepID=A0A9J6BT81_POLVA|nr:hypothetical protein PVAND_003159 [Polypedilum vanderplanki]